MPPIRRREVFRPSRATADRAACGRGAPQESAGAGNVPERSGGEIRRSRTRRVRKHPRAPHLLPHPGSALTECAGRAMPPPLAEPAYAEGMHGDGLAPDGNLAIAEICAKVSEAFGGKIRRSRTRRVRKHPRARTQPGALRHGRVRLRRHSPHTDMQTRTPHHTSHATRLRIRHRRPIR